MLVTLTLLQWSGGQLFTSPRLGRQSWLKDCWIAGIKKSAADSNESRLPCRNPSTHVFSCFDLTVPDTIPILEAYTPVKVLCQWTCPLDLSVICDEKKECHRGDLLQRSEGTTLQCWEGHALLHFEIQLGSALGAGWRRRSKLLTPKSGAPFCGDQLRCSNVDSISKNEWVRPTMD